MPGGNLELGEDPAEAVAREVREELGLMVTPERLLDLWQYHVADGIDVLIGTYVCSEIDSSRIPRLSHEHRQLAWFDMEAVGALPMPDGYKRSIRAACSGSRNGD